ncbi:TIGR03862 family flavoprotein [Acetobacter thailandicus]|uniref:TIGR03862 family flavoprotein n=1 Tax=Acetobacter thailandicus TaxID=1502842 RepID=UPI0031FE8181
MSVSEENAGTKTARVCVAGSGPAGLAAAEYLSAAGCQVHIVEQMPSPGRKLLMAGRGGLNISHSEAKDVFLTRYAEAAPWLAPALAAWTTEDITQWMQGLGIRSFTGSSGRIFPEMMKASPLLRAWLGRLRAQGVQLHTLTRWEGWDAQGQPVFSSARPGHSLSPELASHFQFDAVVLATGGASWPRLGSDGAWAPVLAEQGVSLAPLVPSNCGFQVAWSEVIRERFAGAPLKPVALTFDGRTVQGEIVVTATGLEGGALYALSAPLRQAIQRDGFATLMLDLRPGMSEADLTARLSAVRQRESLSNRLRKALRLPPLAGALLRETGDVPATSKELAARLKAVPVRLVGTESRDRAISTAGGVMHTACDEHFMLTARPGVFVAGEMLDWEAPTGGYLLHACLATGRAAAKGVLEWLQQP